MNFHYIELFIYLSDFLINGRLDKETFLIANKNLFAPYQNNNKKKRQKNESVDKAETQKLNKIFKVLNGKHDKKNYLSKISVLKYCVLLGSNSYEILDLYSFIDKMNKNSIELEEFKLFFSSFLAFSLHEKNKNTAEDENNSFSDNEEEEEIDDLLNEFVEKLNFKKYKNALPKDYFIRICKENSFLNEGITKLIRKTEDSIFTKVFEYNFTLEEYLSSSEDKRSNESKINL